MNDLASQTSLLPLLVEATRDVDKTLIDTFKKHLKELKKNQFGYVIFTCLLVLKCLQFMNLSILKDQVIMGEFD